MLAVRRDVFLICEADFPASQDANCFYQISNAIFFTLSHKCGCGLSEEEYLKNSEEIHTERATIFCRSYILLLSYVSSL